MAAEMPDGAEAEQVLPQLPLDVTVTDLRSLLQLLRSPEDNLKEYAVRGLLQYAEYDAKCFAQVIKLGIGIAEGAIMLPRAEDGALTEEEELLWRVNEIGVVAFFTRFLEDYNDLRLASLEILALLTSDAGVRDNVRVLNAWPFLGSAINPAAEDDRPRANCLKIVCNFAGELTPQSLADLRETTNAEGARNVIIPALVDMYLNDPESELLAIKAIELMSRDLEARVRFLELHATRQLIMAISDWRRSEFQAAAVEALFWLCDDCGNRLECARFEGMQRLMALTADIEKPVLAQGAAQVLAKCCEQIENRELMRQLATPPSLLEQAAETTDEAVDGEEAKPVEPPPLGGLAHLLRILDDKIAPEVVRAALNVLANVSYDPDSCVLLSRLEGTALVVKLLAAGAGGKSQVGLPPKAAAAIVIGNMARHPELRLEAVRAGGATATMRALNDKETSTQEQAAQTLARLACDPMAIAQMKKAGVMKRLVELAGCGIAGPAGAAASCISIYALGGVAGQINDENCSEVLKEGAVACIVELLDEGNPVSTRCAAAWAIQNLALSHEVRDHLDAEGATEQLALMLNNDHLEVALAAIAACKNCVVEEAVANNLCLHGGYTFLTKLRDSSPFESVVRGANGVIEQLLKINLAMKFWLQGSLPSTVKTKDGFFALFGNSGFRTAAELKKEAADTQNIECVTFDYTNDHAYAELVKETVRALELGGADTPQAKVKMLAKVVSDRLGGAVTHSTIGSIGIAQDVALVKAEVESHVLPIGKLRKGGSRHRAFLFKALADTIDLPVTLERSDDGWRLWNCITVKGTEQRIVDLMLQVGECHPVGTEAADTYLQLEVKQDPITNQQHGSLAAPAKRGPTVIDDNLFPHTVVGYNAIRPHFTCPSKLLGKTDLLHNKSGAEFSFQPSANPKVHPKLGGGDSSSDNRDYAAVLADTIALIRDNAESNLGGEKSASSLVESVYSWITQNLRFAYGKGATRHTGGVSTADKVLMQRRGTSLGFSNLFLELAKGVGIEEVQVVMGHCKLYSMLRGAKSTQMKLHRGDEEEAEPEEEVADVAPLKMEHAWNAVKVDGDWQLVDTTAVTYLASTSGEAQGFCMLAPEMFLIDHFPEDATWQLNGDEPMDEQTFQKNSHLRPGSLYYDLQLVSHPGATALPKCTSAWAHKSSSLVVIRAPEGVVISSKVIEYGVVLPESMVLVHQRGNDFFIRAIGPSHGTYTLRVFASDVAKQEEQPSWVCDYTIDMAAVLKQGNIGFLGRCDGQALAVGFVHSPVTINLKSHTTHFFDIEMPGMDQICIGTSRKWGSLDKLEGPPAGYGESFKVDGRFQGALHLEEGDSELFVFAKKEGGTFEAYYKYLSL